jgi:hypothetical protein
MPTILMRPSDMIHPEGEDLGIFRADLLPLQERLCEGPTGALQRTVTRSASTNSPSTGNPGNKSTPRPSDFSPNHRTISQIEATWLPWFLMVGGVGIRSALFSVRWYGCIFSDPTAKRKITDLEFRKELEQRDRVDDRP